MFLVDVSPSMGTMRTVDLPDGQTTEMTNLQWALQFVKLKIQEMVSSLGIYSTLTDERVRGQIFDGRKTDQCGVITFGSDDTNNIISDRGNGGYEHVSEYIPVAQPNYTTLAKLDELEPGETIGDPIDALIVGIETQDVYLGKKKTWTRKIVILTDGENPIEIEDWEATVQKMTSLDIVLTVVGVDFDDEEMGIKEDKSSIKAANEAFFHTLTDAMPNAVLGSLSAALTSLAYPNVKTVKSVMSGSILRIGDVDGRPEEAAEIIVKTSKATSLARPKGWKKFGRRSADNDEEDENLTAYAQLVMRTEYFVDRAEHDEDEEDEKPPSSAKGKGKDADGDDAMEGEESMKKEELEKVEKEELVRGFKYGSTYVACPDGQFPRLHTTKGIDICGFFKAENFRRELPMGEVYYIWGDPASAQQQVALSSIAQAMSIKKVMAIARWVARDGADTKMGVLSPSIFDSVDCLLWVQMPFADDVRKYTFGSLETLVNKKGEVVDKHPYLPTDEQQEAMDNFVDAMDLMYAGEKDEEGNRYPWHDSRFSYNPAIHRTKQALFHSAVVQDLTTNPIPPPHEELTKYFEPPKKVLKRARDAIEECQRVFKVKEVPKKVARQRKDGHVQAARDDDDEPLLLDRPPRRTQTQSHATQSTSTLVEKPVADSSDTEDDEEETPHTPAKKPKNNQPLPTPARSTSPEVVIDPGRAPGRIIGSTYPLKDFLKNISQGDVVTKAVEDLGEVIKEIALKPFASRRHAELLNCMKTLRDTSLKEDEIEAWNDFLRDLKRACLSQHGNQDFWAEVQKQGRGMSLISKPEAAQEGGISAISETVAEEQGLITL
ncbi:hypothetical protein HWV62_38598 [Athelia sp. TMB]|nr:hypothetical protein HWV62_38598 [Athelia sp. TMB]